MKKHIYLKTLEEKCGGVLLDGKHEEDGEACVLEVASVARGVPWTDDPERVGLPDLRALNDAGWSSDVVRTEHLAPVVVALWDWPDWSEERRVAFSTKLAELTIRRVLPLALRAVGLEDEAARCEAEGSAAVARAAAGAAEAAEAAWAARAAARAAAGAAWAAGAAEAAWAARAAARAAAGDAVLIEACRCWVGAAQA
jgi:hypothetical protein